MKVMLKTVVGISLISMFSLSAMEEQSLPFDDLINGARMGNIGLVQKAIENKVDINKQEKVNGWTALMMAAHKGSKDIVELLLKNGANVNLRNNYDRAALYHAVVHVGYKGVTEDGKEIVELLLKSGADVNAADNEGETALMRAAIPWDKPNKGIVDLLINSGANIGLKDKEGNTAWMIARNEGHEELANYIENKAREIQKLMLDTTIKGDQSALKELIAKHGSTLFVDLADAKGNSTLHRAIMNRKFELAAYIIALFPQLLDVKNYGGQTAIMKGLFEQHRDPEFIDFMKKITQTGILRRKGG